MKNFFFAKAKKKNSCREKRQKNTLLIIIATYDDLITEKIIGSAIEVHRYLGPGTHLLKIVPAQKRTFVKF